jgi:hypothetical protein
MTQTGLMQIPEIITNPRSYGTGPGHVDNHSWDQVMVLKRAKVHYYRPKS